MASHDISEIKVAVATLHTEMVSVNKKLDRVVYAIEGNGKPGLNVRVDRLEQSHKLGSKFVWLVIGAIVSAGATLLFTV